MKRRSGVKLIIGLIAKEEYFKQAEVILKKKFGPIDFKSGLLNFDYTDYYQKEFGSNLKRQFLSFKRLIKPKDIIKIKIITNKIERKLSVVGKRRVNIDPGYITASLPPHQNFLSADRQDWRGGKLVLATHKDFYHRIYLGKGVFAEVTLYFQDKSFRPWPWTYPDYKTKDYIDIFNRIRELYLKNLN